LGERTTQENSELAIVKLGGKNFSIPDAEALCRRHANGFFYIAGLSLINMIAIATDSGFTMSLGLGVTQLMQIFALTADDRFWMLMSYVVGSGTIALFLLLGWRARHVERWPFVLGMWLYAADSLIFLRYQDYLAFGFHVFWLFFLSAGLGAVAPIRDAKRRVSAPSRSDDTPSEKLPEFLRVKTQSSGTTSPAAPSGA